MMRLARLFSLYRLVSWYYSQWYQRNSRNTASLAGRRYDDFHLTCRAAESVVTALLLRQPDSTAEKRMVTAKQTRTQRIKERAIRLREELWPGIPADRNWDRKGSDGFTTVPRTLALVGMIADTLADKNKRVSSTYWGLWCRVWDTGVVIIENEYELATEAGFGGERRSYTWRDRIKQLIKLNFIEASKDACAPLALSHWESSESGRARAGLVFVSP